MWISTLTLFDFAYLLVEKNEVHLDEDEGHLGKKFHQLLFCGNCTKKLDHLTSRRFSKKNNLAFCHETVWARLTPAARVWRWRRGSGRWTCHPCSARRTFRSRCRSRSYFRRRTLCKITNNNGLLQEFRNLFSTGGAINNVSLIIVIFNCKSI